MLFKLKSIDKCMHAEFAMLPVLAAVAHAAILSVVHTGDSSVRKSSMPCITDKHRIFKR